uniref:Uncharacterized protein n=1 Tax=Arundo donax TaxID=35708 RepID=A0A0A9AKA3_ARUDO
MRQTLEIQLKILQSKVELNNYIHNSRAQKTNNPKAKSNHHFTILLMSYDYNVYY